MLRAGLHRTPATLTSVSSGLSPHLGGPVGHGAYGIAVTGLHGRPEEAGLVELEDGAPTFHIVRRDWELGADRPPSAIDGRRARLRLLPDGWVDIDGDRGVATFHTPFEMTDAMVAHPFLAPLGGVWARWLGHEAFHGSSVVIDGAAWGILGDKEAGKSTMAAWLSTDGLDVVTDDLLVVEPGASPLCHAGPRFIDLRPAAADQLRSRATAMAVEVRDGERHRFPLQPAPKLVPLGGFVILEDADEVSLDPVPPSERLSRIAPHRMFVAIAGNPTGLLDLVRLPTVRLRRPKEFGQIDAVATAFSTWVRTALA